MIDSLIDCVFLYIYYHFSGFIVTGGYNTKSKENKGVEIIDLTTNRHCVLPNLPDDGTQGRWGHTQV